MSTANAVTENAAAHALAPDHKLLDALTGRWKTEGEGKTEPPNGVTRKISGTTVAERVGESLLVQRWDVRIDGQQDQGLEILRYDPATQTYCSHYYFSNGDSREYQVSFHDGGWTYESESERCRLVFDQADSALTAHWEHKSGSQWATLCDMKSIKLG